MCRDSFIFNEIPSEVYGLMIVSFGNGNYEGSIGSEIEYQKTSKPINKKWKKTGGSVYTTPLNFSIQVCKMDGSYIDSFEKAAISRWLIRQDEYKKLQFCQNDMENMYFNAMVTSIKEYNIGNILGATYGLEISFETDAPWGYAPKDGVTDLEITTAPFSHTFQDLSDEIGYIYPNMTIEILEDGDLKIHNSIEDRTFELDNCTAGEIITVNGDSLTIETNVTSHKIYDDFNYIFFRIANTGETRKNEITYSLPCKITWTYNPIVKVGV